MKTQIENCWGANTSISRTVAHMEEKLRGYFKRAEGLHDKTDRANFVLELCLQEHDYILTPSLNGPKARDLNEALDFYYIRKECRYIEAIMRQFIQNGNFNLSSERYDTVHRLDRFVRIKQTLEELFQVLAENPS